MFTSFLLLPPLGCGPSFEQIWIPNQFGIFGWKMAKFLRGRWKYDNNDRQRTHFDKKIIDSIVLQHFIDYKFICIARTTPLLIINHHIIWSGFIINNNTGLKLPLVNLFDWFTCLVKWLLYLWHCFIKIKHRRKKNILLTNFPKIFVNFKKLFE